MKKIIITLMTVMMLFAQITSVYADENVDSIEWYEMVEEDFEIVDESNENIMPYTAYIVDVITSTAKISSGKLGLRADVLCSSSMQSIRVTFYLQKKSGSSWVTVASKESSSSYGVSHATVSPHSDPPRFRREPCAVALLAGAEAHVESVGIEDAHQLLRALSTGLQVAAFDCQPKACRRLVEAKTEIGVSRPRE